MKSLLSPPIAFLVYIFMVLLINWVGQQLAGPGEPGIVKSSSYGSGEKAPTIAAAPGYRPFFLAAFFFAILHLGMLVLGLGRLTWQHMVYLLGLALTLIALILG